VVGFFGLARDRFKVIAVSTAVGVGLLVFGIVGLRTFISSLVFVDPPLNSNELRSVSVSSSEELEQVFTAENFAWPLQRENVPPLVLQALPKDFPAIADMSQKKALFLRVLLPMALLENHNIKQQRAVIEHMYAQPKLVPQPDSMVGKALDKITKRYRVETDFAMESRLQVLLARLDEVPPSLVLAQGVIESGWGSSRFALEGNSLFGQWTYNPKLGIAPKQRAETATHYVRAFPDLFSSVKAYMRNLNTGRAYRSFREMRSKMRVEQNRLDPLTLAGGLLAYSEKGQAYVNYVRKVIRINDLHLLDGQSLAIAAN
jgi:Bax protein